MTLSKKLFLLHQKEGFEKHAQECSSCKKELEETIKLLEKVSMLPKDSAPAHDLWANIEGRISNKKGKIYRIKNTESSNGFSTNGDSDKKNKYFKIRCNFADCRYDSGCASSFNIHE